MHSIEEIARCTTLAVFTDLDYADDAVLFAQDPGRWQAELERFDDAATTMGLQSSHLVGKDEIAEHRSRSSSSISLR